MIKQDNIISISEMRTNTENVLKRLESREAYYLFSRSKPKAVLLDFDYFADLQEMLEDQFDSHELLLVEDKEIDDATDWQIFKAKITA